METRTLQVNPEDTGTRLDAWLAGQLPDVTRSAAARPARRPRIQGGCNPLEAVRPIYIPRPGL